MSSKPPAPALALTRRAAFLAPLGVAGCDTVEGWFSTKKTPLVGKREAVETRTQGLRPDEGVGKIELPTPVRNSGWPQVLGNPAHAMGHLALGNTLQEAWTASIGTGGGYRRGRGLQQLVRGGPHDKGNVSR